MRTWHSLIPPRKGQPPSYIDNSSRFDGSQPTCPKYLQQAGYETVMIGKWHLHAQPTGFDHWEILPGQGSYANPDFRSRKSRSTIRRNPKRCAMGSRGGAGLGEKLRFAHLSYRVRIDWLPSRQLSGTLMSHPIWRYSESLERYHPPELLNREPDAREFKHGHAANRSCWDRLPFSWSEQP